MERNRLDTAILRCLFLDVHGYPTRSEVREPLSRICRRLRLSEPTVRSRINEYVESGFLRGWRVFVNPHVAGQEHAQVRLDVLPPSAKRDVINKIKLIDGVWYIANEHENALGIAFSYEDEDRMRSRVQLMTRIANSEHANLGQILFPPCGYRFARVDFAIIKAVHGEPWQSYSSIAEDSHLSTRTVKRRLNTMIHERVLFVTPELDVKKLTGAIVADLMVFYLKKETARDTEEKVMLIVNDTFIAIIRGVEHSWFGLLLSGIAEGSEILARVNALEGVREAYLDLTEEYIGQYEVFNDQIEKLSRRTEERNSVVKHSVESPTK